MGTNVAPYLANIFMARFEDTYVYTYKPQPLIWLRFIDDIFCIWTHRQEQLDNFIQFLNSCHKSIKFTTEISNECISFLDTNIILTGGKLITDLYSKPTDSHNYLLFDSCHPAHTKNSIPYSQFLRIRRICTRTEDFLLHCKEIGLHFLRRGYPKKLIFESVEKALRQDRDTLLKNKNEGQSDNDKEKDKLFFLKDTFQPSCTVLKDTLQKNWGILEANPTTRDLSKNRVIFGHRRPTNLP